MAAAQQRDPIVEHIQTSKNLLKLEYHPLPNKGVSILGDISTGTFRPFVPEDFRRKVFDSFDSLSHPGINLGYPKLISRRYTWPGMKADVKQWCLSCVAWQQSKIQRHTMSPLHGFAPPSQKIQHIFVDIVGPLPSSCNHKYLLTIVDRFSRWFEALPPRDISAKSCADAFVLHFVTRYGAPATLTADRGKQFTSGLWKDLAKFLGCELINTTSYNPKANGIVERYHRVLKTSIKAQKQPSDWDSNLGWILLGLRTTIRNDMDFSPANMLYGSSLRLPGEFLSPQKEQSHIEYVQQQRSFVPNLKPTPVRKPIPRSVYIDRKLSTCFNVFVRHDAVKIGLQRPYNSPYKVLPGTDKYFKINLNGIEYNVSIDRLKPAILLSDFEEHTSSDNQTNKLQHNISAVEI